MYKRQATTTDIEGTTALYREAFWIAAIVVLFPLLILVNTATRLAAARREERFAAMRLVGGTGRQVNVVATVESAVSAVFGTLLGIGGFLAVRPALAQISFSGARFFDATVTPTAAGYLGMLVAVPAVATLSSLWSLRRVRISPLGVSRKVTPPPPRAWRALPLLVGIPLFVIPLLGDTDLKSQTLKTSPTTPLLYVGTFLIMAGLVLGGSWLTMQVARGLARISRGASSLLAARRLADNPKNAFRAVSGLVLAVFVGSLLASVVPVINAAQTSLGGNASSLTDVLRAPFSAGPGSGLPAGEAAKLIGKLRGPGVTVLAVYNDPSFNPNPGPPPGPVGPNAGRGPRSVRTSTLGEYDSIVSCAGLSQFPALGHCATGEKAVQANISGDLQTDNPLTITLPVVTQSNPTAPANTLSLIHIYERDGLAGRDVQVEVVQHLSAVRIGEPDMVEVHVATALDQVDGARRALYFLWLVEDLVDPPGGGRSPLAVHDHHAELAERRLEDEHVGLERKQRPHT